MLILVNKFCFLNVAVCGRNWTKLFEMTKVNNKLDSIFGTIYWYLPWLHYDGNFLRYLLSCLELSWCPIVEICPAFFNLSSLALPIAAMLAFLSSSISLTQAFSLKSLSFIAANKTDISWRHATCFCESTFPETKIGRIFYEISLKFDFPIIFTSVSQL